MTIFLRSVFSSLKGRFGAPKGYLMLAEVHIRLTPTAVATGVILQTWIAGIPALSNSFTITAPQRVDVPQVEVWITASISWFFTYSAIEEPILRLLAILVIRPVVPR